MSYTDLRKERRSIAGQEYLVTTVCRNRMAVFSDLANADAFGSFLRQMDDPGESRWLAWILMPDHCHGLLRLGESEKLSSAMQRLKERTAREIADLHGQPGFHDHALRANEDRVAVARYLLANPVRAGLVTSLREYPYWYCCWFRADDDPDDLLVEP